MTINWSLSRKGKLTLTRAFNAPWTNGTFLRHSCLEKNFMRDLPPSTFTNSYLKSFGIRKFAFATCEQYRKYLRTGNQFCARFRKWLFHFFGRLRALFALSETEIKSNSEIFKKELTSTGAWLGPNGTPIFTLKLNFRVLFSNGEAVNSLRSFMTLHSSQIGWSFVQKASKRASNSTSNSKTLNFRQKKKNYLHRALFYNPCAFFQLLYSFFISVLLPIFLATVFLST